MSEPELKTTDIERFTTDKISFEQLQEFANICEELGVFTRRYDGMALDRLYEVVKNLHKHLCSLDNSNYKGSSIVSLEDLANVYARLHDGIRLLK